MATGNQGGTMICKIVVNISSDRLAIKDDISYYRENTALH
jgi:hypothetical protein